MREKEGWLRKKVKIERERRMDETERKEKRKDKRKDTV